MTTPAQRREATAATRAFQAYIAQQSAETLTVALQSWQSTPPEIRVATAGSWLEQIIRLILGRREHSREVGLAYYRLVRALRTGTTIADNRRPEPKYVSIAALRNEFEALTKGLDRPAPTGEDIPASEGVEVENLLDVKKYMADDARNARETVARSLVERGPALTQSQVDEGKRTPAEAHESAGPAVAGAAQRHVANGGRHLVSQASRSDRRAIGYVRISTTGTPCGFCAMLISRGAFFYESAKTAQNQGDNQMEDKYHDHCKCVAEPVFSRAQYGSEDIYALNREYSALWPQVTKGLYGTDALNAWRTYITAKNKATPTEVPET